MGEISLETITAEILRERGTRHGFFTRRGGVSEGTYATLNAGRGSRDQPHAVAENRARIAAHLGVSRDALVSMHQTHSADVLVLQEP
ncbi:MAG: laccase domain-containing protein, partial [Pseudomonadota bacterium]